MALSARRAVLGRTLLAPLLLLSSPAGAQRVISYVLGAGVPLHVRITRTARMRLGAPVQGMLTQPVFLVDRLAIPAGSKVQGTVERLIPADHEVRLRARLDGDLTPLHQPIVLFDRVIPPGGQFPIILSAQGRIRNVQFLRFVARAKRPSLFEQGIAMVKSRIKEVDAVVLAPGKKDRALRLLYSQLPYHPQRLWAGTGMVADLDAPVSLNLPPAPPILHSTRTSLDNLLVDARLATGITSATAHRGDPVTAIVTRPVLDSDHRLIIPQGATLDGVVAKVRAARRLGRNGQLRLGFRGIRGALSTSSTTTSVHGTLVGAEGATSAHVTVDREGNVQAHPAQNRFVAPLLLALTAAQGNDRDRDGSGVQDTTIASNGFGLVARVIALTVNDRHVAVGFGAYAFAKSVYFRLLARGHDVAFPKDTMVEVQLSERLEGMPAPL